MSDLGRLRERLARVERSGKRLARELGELKDEIAAQPTAMTRDQEQRVLSMEREVDQRRKDWLAVQAKLAAEERRLLEPGAMLRFT